MLCCAGRLLSSRLLLLPFPFPFPRLLLFPFAGFLDCLLYCALNTAVMLDFFFGRSFPSAGFPAPVYKLLISARANSARINLTTIPVENPQQPPMLCMLLRKKLQGAKLLEITQPDLERALMLKFDSVNELGDHVELTLAVEIMGRYSNIILVDENGKIIDALKRVDAEMSSERLVLPGLLYRLPPPQDKLSMLTCTVEEIMARIDASLTSGLLVSYHFFTFAIFFILSVSYFNPWITNFITAPLFPPFPHISNNIY